jgi:hypothetical protein
METVSALEENFYLVPGQVIGRRGVHHVFVPRRQWSEYVEIVRTRGRRAAQVEPRRAPHQTRAQWMPSWSQAFGQGSALPSFELHVETPTSVLTKVNSTTETEASKKAPVGELTILPDQAVDLMCADDDALDDLVRPKSVGGFMFVGDAPPLVPIGPRGSHPYLPPDSHPRPPLLVTYISPEMGPEQMAREVVDGYRRAVRAVYGISWWHYSKGDIKKARGFDRLLAAGIQLAEHSVPAEHWAIWRLRFFKKGKQFSDTPPPVWLVMSAKFVSERAGWFRKEYDLPVPVLKPDPIITEQHLRNTESEKLWMGHSAVTALMFLPRWYAEMRRVEIAGGCYSPHDCWPCKPGSKYGKVH